MNSAEVQSSSKKAMYTVFKGFLQLLHVWLPCLGTQGAFLVSSWICFWVCSHLAGLIWLKQTRCIYMKKCERWHPWKGGSQSASKWTLVQFEWYTNDTWTKDIWTNQKQELVKGCDPKKDKSIPCSFHIGALYVAHYSLVQKSKLFSCSRPLSNQTVTVSVCLLFYIFRFGVKKWQCELLIFFFGPDQENRNKHSYFSPLDN